jgi:hypothetical protein
VCGSEPGEDERRERGGEEIPARARSHVVRGVSVFGWAQPDRNFFFICPELP